MQHTLLIWIWILNELYVLSKCSIVDTQIAEESSTKEQSEDFSDARDVLSQQNLRYANSVFILILSV